MEYRTINNGIKMPVLGFGVFQVSDPKVCVESALTAIRHGYRLIDTAAVYGNEAAVGTAIRKCDVPREELFITTKLWVQDAGYEKTKAAFAASLDRLVLSFFRKGILDLPLMILANLLWPMYGLMLVQPFMEFTGSMIALGMYRKQQRTHLITQNGMEVSHEHI